MNDDEHDRRGEVELFECLDANRQLQRFALAVETAGHSIYITDTDGYIVYVNPEFCKVSGYGKDELLGRTPSILKSGLMDERYYQKLWQTILAGNIWSEEVINRRKDGSLYHALQTIAPITGEDARIEGYVAIQSDISAQKELERQLSLSESRYRSILDSMREGVVLYDAKGRILTANPSAERILGYDSASLHSRTAHDPIWKAIHEDGTVYNPDDFPLQQVLHKQVSIDDAVMGLRQPDASVTWLNINARPVLDDEGRLQFVITTFADITERKLREDAIRQAAENDFLTGLKNRYAMNIILRSAFFAAERYKDALSLIFLDIDNFKRVNDTWGHEIGDLVLKRTARVLQESLRGSDVASRWGGEEFIIMCPKADTAAAARLAERLRKAVADCRVDPVGGITISLGVASLSPGDDMDSLLVRADTNLYKAKKAGRNRVCF